MTVKTRMTSDMNGQQTCPAAVGRALLSLAIVCALMMGSARADVFINVMAVNGSSETKQSNVHFNLPGDLKKEDILDTNGLDLDYNVNDANFFVHGKVDLKPKESKTYRIRVKDIWRTSPEQSNQIKEEINKGFEQIGKLQDEQKAEALRKHLLEQLDLITEAQSTKAETVTKRIDAFRAYRKEVEYIKDQALAVDFWRSEPGTDERKILRIKLEANNSPNAETNKVKIKEYLPAEIKPQHVVDDQGFEVRFDQARQQAFLYKEDEIEKGKGKSFNIGIRDVWFIPQRNIDYMRQRAAYAYDFLKNSKFLDSAKFLFDHANTLLADIEHAQTLTLPIKEHISAHRTNQKSFEDVRTDVENLEKLLMLLREDLEKSKVENVLQKVRSLKGMAGIAEQMFDKKPQQSTAWNFIGLTVLFVGLLTFINFVVWVLRSNDKKKKDQEAAAKEPTEAQKK